MFTKEFWKDAITRAIKTFAQTAVSLITVGQAITEIHWYSVLSISATAFVLSVLMSLAHGDDSA